MFKELPPMTQSKPICDQSIVNTGDTEMCCNMLCVGGQF